MRHAATAPDHFGRGRRALPQPRPPRRLPRRGRRGGRMEDRVTGNAAVARYLHDTSRPAKDDGRPDPQLHAHNEWMNLTFDHEEERIKAAKVQDFYRDSFYYRMIFEEKLIGK